MTVLTVYNLADQTRPRLGDRETDFTGIQNRLSAIGVQFERWAAEQALADDADQDAIKAAYEDAINRLTEQYGFQSVDVINLTPGHADKAALRQKFLAEHTHDDFEVRFFIAGRGLFYLHVDNAVYAVLCEQGDLISVPANTPHWFDMGENPDFKTLRFFTRVDGWVAQFTGNTIAETFPTLDELLAELA